MPDASQENVCVSTALPVVRVEKGTSLWKDAYHRLSRNRLAMFGSVFLIFVTLLSLVAPLIVPYNYDAQDLSLGASGPSAQHWLGTDQLGRDLFTRILYGGRVSLMVGFAATGVSLIVGLIYGAVSGYAGGKTDSVMMRLVDILYALPFTIFVVILMVFFGRNIILMFLAIGCVQWLTMARIVRGQVLTLKQMDFVSAAEVLGYSRRRIILRHIIPNVLGPVIIYTTLTVPNVMLLEAFLSFLGLGVQAPMSSWGVLIKEGADVMEEYPWLLLYPSIALSATLFALNWLGDGLRDALDPRAAKD